MKLFKPSTLADSFGIDVDSEGIGLNTVMERAYQRAVFATGDLDFAEEHATTVTVTLANHWEKDSQLPSRDGEAMGYFVQRNRAFQIEIVSFAKLNNCKRERLEEHLADRRNLHKDTLGRWFIDHLVNYGLRRHSGYAATCSLKVLFNYTYRDLEEILELIDEKWDSFEDRKDRLRRWKKKIFKDLTDWFGPIISTTRTSEGSFTEQRFRKQPVTVQSLSDVSNFMNFLTPLRPACAFATNYTVELYDLGSILTGHALSSSLHAVERERIHLMNHARDLFRVLEQLGMSRQLKSPAESLELPEFGSGLANSNDLEPPPPQELPSLKNEQKKRIEHEVRKRRKRIRRLASNSVQILIDNEMRMELELDQSRKCELTLNEGDSLLEIQATDHKGPLPLSTLFIPWDPRLTANDTLTYHISPLRGCQILFRINYDRNQFGDFDGATLDIHYSPRVAAPAALPGLRDLVRFTHGEAWVPRFVFAVLIIGIVVGAFWYARKTTEVDDVSNRPASHVGSYPSPLPSATVQNVEVDPTPPRDESVPIQKKMTSSQRRELLAQANFLNLEQYTTSGGRGNEAGERTAKPLSSIHASRTQLTLVRIHLDHEMPAISSVGLQDAFLDSIAPGTIESSTRTSVTVRFDLRTVRRGDYFLAVTTSSDRPPKHYLIRIL